jgi:hypothetical protein
MSGAFLIGRGPDGKDKAAEVNADGALKVDIASATLDVTASGVEIKNDSGNPIPVVTGLEIPEHDYIALSYTGANLTGVVYKTGGSSGTTVATLTLAYDGSGNLTSVTKS